MPKWTVGGAGSSPDLVMFENSNCRAQEPSFRILIRSGLSERIEPFDWSKTRCQDFNKTHYYLFVDLINPKKSCGTKRRSEGIEIIYENFITWNNREDRRVEKLANVSCTQYLEEKHVRIDFQPFLEFEYLYSRKSVQIIVLFNFYLGFTHMFNK